MASVNPPSQYAIELWTRTPMYIVAIAQSVGAGAGYSYPASRRARYSTGDRTTFMPGQVSWSEETTPDILSVVRPPPEWKTYAIHHTPQEQRNQHGLPRYEQWAVEGVTPRVLRDLPILPLQIFTDEPGWSLEAWFRLDPTITFDDILMRMNIEGRPTEHDLSMRRSRTRNDLGLEFWEVEDTHEHDARYNIVLSQLPSPAQIRATAVQIANAGVERRRMQAAALALVTGAAESAALTAINGTGSSGVGAAGAAGSANVSPGTVAAATVLAGMATNGGNGVPPGEAVEDGDETVDDMEE